MKSQKGMSHIMLLICIVLILAIVGGILYITNSLNQERILENYQTEMLMLQSKVKILSQESIMQKKDELLKGKKVSENLEDENIKQLLENKIISQEEESFDKYYILDKANIEEMGLANIVIEDGFYIVNYDTDEIIYSNGIVLGKETYYKLSQIQKRNEIINQTSNEVANEIINEAE